MDTNTDWGTVYYLHDFESYDQTLMHRKNCIHHYKDKRQVKMKCRCPRALREELQSPGESTSYFTPCLSTHSWFYISGDIDLKAVSE